VRRDVEFEGFGGVELRGWLYLPQAPAGQVPGVVMAHGFSGVKEQFLDRYAEVLSAAGMGVLVYDHANFGASGGEPRQLINPWAQARDYRFAARWLRDRAEIDAARMALWGTSFSGGEVAVIAALDDGYRAVVANVPFTGYPGVDYTADPGRIEAIRGALETADGTGPADGGDVMGPLALIEEDGYDGMVMFAGSNAGAVFAAGAEGGASSWQNRVSVQSAFSGDPMWDPGYAFEHLRAPLLMVVAAQDTVAPAQIALDAFARAPEPKRLVTLDCAHFEAYTGDEFTESSTAMAEFLTEQLLA